MKEALKLALKALERGETELRWRAITAIKEALAQPEQEPVAVTYGEVADAMNSLWNGTLEQHQIAEQMANKKLYTTPPAQSAQEPKDIAELVEGMEVSIDVSTGDHDSGHRLFGIVTLVQENQGSKHGLILLVQDIEANFEIALAQPEERNFCPRCGKRTADLTMIHTCTPPQENT